MKIENSAYNITLPCLINIEATISRGNSYFVTTISQISWYPWCNSISALFKKGFVNVEINCFMICLYLWWYWNQLILINLRYNFWCFLSFIEAGVLTFNSFNNITFANFFNNDTWVNFFNYWIIFFYSYLWWFFTCTKLFLRILNNFIDNESSKDERLPMEFLNFANLSHKERWLYASILRLLKNLSWNILICILYHTR